MKKILTIIIALTLVLVMTGCKKDTLIPIEDLGGYDECYLQEANGFYREHIVCYDGKDNKITFNSDNTIGYISRQYYTYKETDALIKELEDDLWEMNKKVNRINERVYELESELRDFERFKYEDLIEFMNEFDDWEDTIVFLTKSEYDDLLQRIEILEGGN